jgi:hypothetical protein
MINTQRHVSVSARHCAFGSVIHDMLTVICRAFDVTSPRHLLLAPGSIVAYPIMISVVVSAGSLKKHNAYWITCYYSRDLVLIVSDTVQRSCYYSLFCTYLRCSVESVLLVYHIWSTAKWKYGFHISGFESCRGEIIFSSRLRFKETLRAFKQIEMLRRRDPEACHSPRNISEP